MIDLKTNYLGLQLRTPLVASASPLSQEIDSILQLEDAGASAVVLYSLFEEQLRQESIELEQHLAEGTDSFAEASSFFPQPDEFRLGPEGYLNHIHRAKKAVSVPIIASLNGTTVETGDNWHRYCFLGAVDVIQIAFGSQAEFIRLGEKTGCLRKTVCAFGQMLFKFDAFLPQLLFEQ